MCCAVMIIITIYITPNAQIRFTMQLQRNDMHKKRKQMIKSKYMSYIIILRRQDHKRESLYQFGGKFKRVGFEIALEGVQTG